MAPLLKFAISLLAIEGPIQAIEYLDRRAGSSPQFAIRERNS